MNSSLQPWVIKRSIRKFPMSLQYRYSVLCIALAISACAPAIHSPQGSAQYLAESHLVAAEKKSLSPEQRAVLYLNSAKEASQLLASPASAKDASEIYNQAVANLTVLLRSAENGRMWNQPLTLASGGTSYRLRFAKPTRDGTWDPAYFTGITRASDVPNGDLDTRNLRDGLGGTLVGNHRPDPTPPHLRPYGIYTAITAVLDFKGNEALLTLLDPSEKTSTRVAGTQRPLAADFSAPLASYPQGSELWNGIMATLRVEQHMGEAGLFMLRPYDPDRIPVIFVHGLASTPRMWRRVINELECDPEFRLHYQCWLFGYPTGNPPAYSAKILREQMASIENIHPDTKPFVLIGHSMGGILSRMQVTTVTRADWNVMGKEKAAKLFAHVKPGDIVDRSTRYQADSHVNRVIFICTPHRGSEMAIGSLGQLAAKLISLPGNLTSAVLGSLGDSISIVTGDSKRMPNSVTGLAPGNPLFKVLDHSPIQAKYHSIIGDRGKGDTPNSSDGVVEYWSSHLDGATSETIVPGPHGACELPETLAEIRRILHLHLIQN